MAKGSTGMSNSVATWATHSVQHILTTCNTQMTKTQAAATSRGWHRSVAFRMKLITFGTFH